MADRRLQTGLAPPASSLHPRRRPANASVSLLHSSRKRQLALAHDHSESSSDSAVNTHQKATRLGGSPSSLQPHGRESSGESSNADKWFEKSNNEVHDNDASFADDPPFFMRNSSSSETPPDALHQMRQMLGSGSAGNSLPLRTGLLHLGTDGSSTEDFRGVIDDLTIENKKLKRRLKKYEKLHDSHLRDEKLFEIRVHGLPAEKKRELEETLRKFAASLGTNGFPANGYGDLLPMLHKQNTASSQVSMQNTDSAYASMSASGQGSSAQSGTERRHKNMASIVASRRQNIHSYLHHIPGGLLPQQNPSSMTERAKKKLVVRRLEQIFAGKGASGGHQHSLQQQYVSQMAARADKIAGEASDVGASNEGRREASIMHQETEDSTGQGENETSEEMANQLPEKTTNTTNAPGRSGEQPSEEQRPTRPLDLDPQRAQVPADNIRYMRHLGFSPSDTDDGPQLEDGHGWIYLNLLVNMAQLHTINVTAEFVRKALTERSSKFEISPDGRKVRWRGGRSVTRNSSSDSASPSSRAELETPDCASPRKRPKLAHRDSGKSAANLQQGARSNLRNSEYGRLVYTPLFFHKDSTDGGDESTSEDEDDSMSSPYPPPAAGDSSGMTSSGIRTSSTKKAKKRDDGPIIFYTNARFCTDLSGDRKPDGNLNAPPYTAASSMPLGMRKAQSSGLSYEPRGPLADASELPEPMDLSDNPIPESMELSFPQNSPPTSSHEQVPELKELEVTGIGGVWPADHFSIAVESRHARLDPGQTVPDLPSKHVPAKFARILRSAYHSRKPRAAVQNKTMSSRKIELPPSTLPPALSFMPFHEDSYDDDESDPDDGMSLCPESPGAFPPSAAPQPVELHYASSDEEDEEDDDDDDDDISSEGSVDMLAAARQFDPEAIRRQEREYDATMAERLAEEIPAGSSAATAGGGSGFASPAVSGTTREEYRQMVAAARNQQRPAPLKRARTSDSMKVQNPKTSDSEDDEDDDEDDANMMSIAS